jgi:hypothetical protein
MAELLQRKFSLPVVKVRLGELHTRPEVRIELVANAEGRQWIVGTRTHRLHEFGLTESPTEEPRLRVPESLVEWIASAREALWIVRGHPTVLWLHLVKPYGPLGAIPWERDLQPAVEVPLLRLPDALPTAETSGSTFHVALCVTALTTEGRSTAMEMAPKVASAISGGVGNRLRLHVFAEPETYDQLESDLNSIFAPGEAVVYRPRKEFDRLPVPASGPQNLWLRWIRDAMQGRTLDAVHFITHGYRLGNDGAILTTISPTSKERLFPQPVQAGELRTFLTQVGALVAGFTVPFDNYSDYGLFRAVDDLGALRAGPVLLHDPRGDGTMVALERAYFFLWMGTWDPGWPPADPSLLLYAQPSQIPGPIPKEYAPDEILALRSSPAVREHLAREETPVWLAAAERFINESEGDLIRFRDSTLQRQPTRAQTAYYTGVEVALRQIRAVVNKHAEANL